MATDEEYLDSLLKDIMENDVPSRVLPEEMINKMQEDTAVQEDAQPSFDATNITEPLDNIDVAPQQTEINSVGEMTADDLADMLDKIDDISIEGEEEGEAKDIEEPSYEPEDIQAIAEEYEANEQQDTVEEPDLSSLLDNDETPDLSSLLDNDETPDLSNLLDTVEESDSSDSIDSVEEPIDLAGLLSDEENPELSNLIEQEASSELDNILNEEDTEELDKLLSEGEKVLEETDEEVAHVTEEITPVEEITAAEDTTPTEDTIPVEDTRDVTELLDEMGEDSDLAEINGLLKKSDNNEVVDDDILSMLQNAVDAETNGENAEEPYDIFAEDADNTGEKVEETKKSKKEKKRKGRNKKKADSEEAQTEGEPKELGFFGKILKMLTDSEEDEESETPVSAEDNVAILEQLEQEDSAAAQKEEAKKDKKNKRGKKGKKGKEEANQEGDGEEAGDEKDKGKKPKKPKKEKKPKPEKEPEPPSKKLSKKKLMLVAVFCLSIVAVIVAICTFWPDYTDKKKAREAFYINDYESVYEHLYDKNLNASDQILFNQAQTILKMQRKLDSYNNYMSMNMPEEALNALILGVQQTTLFDTADAYGVRAEVEAIYNQMLSILSDEYGITSEDLAIIGTYDAVTYTKKIQSIVFGTEFLEPGLEAEEPKAPQDILPAEEGMLDENIPENPNMQEEPNVQEEPNMQEEPTSLDEEVTEE